MTGVPATQGTAGFRNEKFCEPQQGRGGLLAERAGERG